MRKGTDVDEDAELVLQFDTKPAFEPENLEPLPSKETLAEDSHQPEVQLDDAGNEVPDMSTDTDDVPDIDMDRPLRVTFGKELRYAPTLTELIRCRSHRDTTLQPVPLLKVGLNTPYPSSLKGTHRRVHRHYPCNDLTSTAVWAAAYQEDQRTRHIYEVAVRSPMARLQIRDPKLSFDDGKFFHLSTVGKRVLVPRTLATSIVAMYHESEFCGHLGVLRTVALIKRDYICSHLRRYVKRCILCCDVCQAAKSRRVDTARQPRPLPLPDTKWHTVSVDSFSGLPWTTRGHDAIRTVVERFSKRGMFISCRKDMTADDPVYVFLREVIPLKGCPRQIVSDPDKLVESQAWKEWVQRLRIEMHQTLDNHPRGNGVAEHSNRSILQRLSAHGVTRQARAFASRIRKCSNCCILVTICAISSLHFIHVWIPQLSNDALCRCLFHGAEGTLNFFGGMIPVPLRYSAAGQARAGHYSLIWILGLLVPLPSTWGFI